MLRWFDEDTPKYIFICDCNLCDGLGNIIKERTLCECCKYCLHGDKFVVKYLNIRKDNNV